MTNADRAALDHLDVDIWNAVLKIRRHHNQAQARLGLPITNHSNRSPWEQEGQPADATLRF